MIEAPSHDDAKNNGIARIGAQPIALAGIALAVVLSGIGSIAIYRASTGHYPETDRAVTARQLQARATEASEQLVEKTKALEVTEQESVDQLQALQDQMQGMKRLLASQQGDARRLSDQIASLSGAIDNLRQSFASAQTADTPAPPQARAAGRTRSHAARSGTHKRAKSRG